MRMRKSLIAIAAATCALAAVAQQLCLSPQLVNGLVFLGDPQAKVSVTRGDPAFTRGLKLPDSLVLIGSGMRGDGIQTVAYRTSLTTDKAYAAVVEAFGADGWATETPPGATGTFSVAGSPREATFCRGGERRYVLVTEISGTRYVQMLVVPQSPTRQCDEEPFAL